MFKKVDTKSLEAKTAQMLKTHLQGNSIIITPISETEIAINLGTIAGVVAPDENSKKSFYYHRGNRRNFSKGIT